MYKKKICKRYLKPLKCGQFFITLQSKKEKPKLVRRSPGKVVSYTICKIKNTVQYRFVAKKILSKPQDIFHIIC